ncbi:hypothetical protein K474DRAFT_1662999 [Panus rudis PR-1116 ss-1]|nr:hypothetical protein K474DRAFT_1662999 [Panus rudis PR-1116 ss-1]
MAESYKELFKCVEFQQGTTSDRAVELFDRVVDGAVEGESRVNAIVPTRIQIRKSLSTPYHEYILADLHLRDERSRQPLGLLLLERSYLDSHPDPNDPAPSSPAPDTTQATNVSSRTEPDGSTNPASNDFNSAHARQTYPYPPPIKVREGVYKLPEQQRKRTAGDFVLYSSQSSTRAAFALGTSAHDTVQFLPMEAAGYLNTKSLPVLEMSLKDEASPTTISEYAVLQILILAHQYTMQHALYRVTKHQCYHFAIYIFRAVEALLNGNGLYFIKTYQYSGERSHIKRGYFRGLLMTKDVGPGDQVIPALVSATHTQLLQQLQLWQKRGNIADERRQREEAERQAEEERMQKEVAQRKAEEAQRKAEEAQRKAEEAQRKAEEAQRVAEEAQRKAADLEAWLAQMHAAQHLTSST